MFTEFSVAEARCLHLRRQTRQAVTLQLLIITVLLSTRGSRAANRSQGFLPLSTVRTGI